MHLAYSRHCRIQNSHFDDQTLLNFRQHSQAKLHQDHWLLQTNEKNLMLTSMLIFSFQKQFVGVVSSTGQTKLVRTGKTLLPKHPMTDVKLDPGGLHRPHAGV